jgi:hypothetical protein
LFNITSQQWSDAASTCAARSISYNENQKQQEENVRGSYPYLQVKFFDDFIHIPPLTTPMYSQLNVCHLTQFALFLKVVPPSGNAGKNKGEGGAEGAMPSSPDGTLTIATVSAICVMLFAGLAVLFVKKRTGRSATPTTRPSITGMEGNVEVESHTATDAVSSELHMPNPLTDAHALVLRNSSVEVV